jgi:hypothetical protein
VEARRLPQQEPSSPPPVLAAQVVAELAVVVVVERSVLPLLAVDHPRPTRDTRDTWRLEWIGRALRLPANNGYGTDDHNGPS